MCSQLRFTVINNPQLQISFLAQITQIEPRLKWRGSLTMTSSEQGSKLQYPAAASSTDDLKSLTADITVVGLFSG